MIDKSGPLKEIQEYKFYVSSAKFGFVARVKYAFWALFSPATLMNSVIAVLSAGIETLDQEECTASIPMIQND